VFSSVLIESAQRTGQNAIQSKKEKKAGANFLQLSELISVLRLHASNQIFQSVPFLLIVLLLLDKTGL
jgi:hypothetical protein